MYCCLFLEMFTAFWFYVLLFSSVWHYLLYEFYFMQPCFKVLNIWTYSQGKTADTCTVPYYRVLNDFILQGPYNGVTYISGKKKKKKNAPRIYKSCRFLNASVPDSQEKQGRQEAERGSQGHRQRVMTKPVHLGQAGSARAGGSQQ